MKAEFESAGSDEAATGMWSDDEDDAGVSASWEDDAVTEVSLRTAVGCTQPCLLIPPK